MRGDLGNSFVDRSPVGPALARALGVTASLVGVALLLGVTAGGALGTAAGVVVEGRLARPGS